MPRVNYVIACWMGLRRAEDRRSVKDRAFFLKEHLNAIEKSRHNLDAITVVLAMGGDQLAESYALSIKSVGGTPVRVLQRENTGYSYASWNHAFDIFGDDFTHSILVEDDYAPWVHDFDSILVDHADRKNTYVCSKMSRRGFHGAISNGIIPHDVWRKCHPAPWSPGHTPKEGNSSQRIWTAHFSQCGYPIQDYTDTHSSPFWTGRKIIWYGDTGKPPLLMPINALDRSVPVSYGDEMKTMTISGRDLRVEDG